MSENIKNNCRRDNINTKFYFTIVKIIYKSDLIHPYKCNLLI